MTEGRRQKAEGRRQKQQVLSVIVAACDLRLRLRLLSAFCLLLSAFCFLLTASTRSSVSRRAIRRFTVRDRMRREPRVVCRKRLHDVGIDQKLNEQLPLDLVFRNENGETVKLGDYFGKKPVVLSLVYYECPMLCNQVLNGMVTSFRVLSFQAGRRV